MLKKEKGISMITLVITIVVIMILAAISIQTSSDIPDEANYTKYISQMKDIQTGVDNVRIKNAIKGTEESKLTKGFDKVYLEDAPASFESFDEAGMPITGYVVNLETINFGDSKLGKAYSNYSSGDTITFGNSEADVYVFDGNWNVYYVKGLKYDGSMNYTFK